MPLIKATLENKLKSRIKALEPKLYNALKAKTTGLYKAQLIVDQKLTNEAPSSGFDIIKYKNKIWTYNAEEWSKVLSKEIIKLLAEDISDIVSSEITTYIKSATIITPAPIPVQVAPTTGTGATTSVSAPAKIT